MLEAPPNTKALYENGQLSLHPPPGPYHSWNEQTKTWEHQPSWQQAAELAQLKALQKKKITELAKSLTGADSLAEALGFKDINPKGYEQFIKKYHEVKALKLETGRGKDKNP